MKFKDFYGKEHNFALDLKYKVKSEENCKSNPQFLLGQMLCQIYGRNNIFEDYPLPGCGNLSWDFWIPFNYIAFEFDGQQHQEFNKFFHGNKAGFLKQKKADSRKERLAELNGIRLITISKSITFEELKSIIKESV